MKKMSVLILVLFFGVAVACANEAPKTEIFEDKHKDAQFIWLLYNVDVKVNEDWSFSTHVHKTIKVLKEDSKDMGEIPIQYLRGTERITDINAFTITPDGRKHRYTKIQDVKASDDAFMYTDNMVKIITLPEVNIGSVLEHEYTISSKGLPMKKAFWYTSAVDINAPAKELRLSITVPKKLGIKAKEFGLTRKPVISETKSDITYAWVVKDIDGAKDDENYLPPPTPESFKESIEFSSVPRWSDVSAWYLSLVKKNLKITPEMTALVGKLTAGKQTFKDKTKAVKEYIQDNFRYVSMSFGDNAMEPHPTDQVFKNKYGDCKDLSLLTVALLKAAGIEAQMALFNQEFNINDPRYDLPIPSLFNHVVVLVKDARGGDFYVDPLLEEYDIDQYPLWYQGAYTFIITEDGGRFDKWPISSEDRDRTVRDRDITIKEDGTAVLKIETLDELDRSVSIRKKINAMDKEGRDKFFESLENMVAGNGQVIERRIDGLDQKYGPLKYHTIVRRNDDYPVTDDIMIIDVNSVGGGSDFAAKTRKNPIFFPGNSLAEETDVYHIPAGFNVYYLPKNIDLDIGLFSVKRDYVHKGNEIRVTETRRYRRAQLPKEDYAKVKDFFDKLSGKTQQRIILRKKS